MMMKKRIPLMLCILFCTASLAHSFLPSSWIPSGTASTNSATTAEFGQFVNQIDTMDVNARFNIGINLLSSLLMDSSSIYAIILYTPMLQRRTEGCRCQEQTVRGRICQADLTVFMLHIMAHS